MFFVTKNGTRKRVAEAVRPMIQIVEATGGAPSGFWEDPIILGYLSGCIRGLIEVVSNGRYKGANAGEITTEVFIDLLGVHDNKAVLERLGALQRDEDYGEAVRSGYLSVMVAEHGPEEVMDQAIVVGAIAHQKKIGEIADRITGPISDAASVSSAIQDLVFNRRVEVLRERI